MRILRGSGQDRWCAEALNPRVLGLKGFRVLGVWGRGLGFGGLEFKGVGV